MLKKRKRNSELCNKYWRYFRNIYEDRRLFVYNNKYRKNNL